MSTCDCGAFMRRTAMELDSDPVDTEVTKVGPLGVIQRHPAFPPNVMKCPHGVTWASQPTDWQIKDWAVRHVS